MVIVAETSEKASAYLDNASSARLEFINQLFGPDDIIEFRAIKSPDQKRRFWCYAHDAASHIATLERWNRGEFNIYVGINPRREMNPPKELKGDINVLSSRYLFADFDGTDLDDAMRRIQAGRLPHPSIIVESGHGIHVYWKLQEPITDMKHWTNIQNRIAHLLDSDPKIQNPERLMRLPGTINFKNYPDSPKTICRMIEQDGSLHDLVDIELVLRQVNAKPDSQELNWSNQSYQKTASDDSNISNDSDISNSNSIHLENSFPQAPTSEAELFRMTLPTGAGQRVDCLMRLARGVRRNLGMTDRQTINALLRRWFDLALPVIRTKKYSETQADFWTAYENAKYPLGCGLTDVIWQQIDIDGLPLVTEEYDNDAKRLVGLCRELARSNDDDGRFFLGSHKAAKLTGLTQSTCWRLLRIVFAKDGLIKLEKRGGKTLANRYCWIGGGR